MGTASYILAGTEEGMNLAFGSCCHGAGRAMSRTQATKRWHGKDIVMHLAQKGIIIKGSSMRGIAEEAPAPTRTSAPSWTPRKKPAWPGRSPAWNR